MLYSYFSTNGSTLAIFGLEVTEKLDCNCIDNPLGWNNCKAPVRFKDKIFWSLDMSVKTRPPVA